MNIVFLGCTNSYGRAFSACNTKVEFMARGLTLRNDTCYIHNGLNGTSGIKVPSYIPKIGVGTIVDYPIRGNFYVSAIYNYRRLTTDLKRWFCPDTVNWVIVEAPYLPYYYMNIIAARNAGYRVAVISHEWLGTFRNRNMLKRWINNFYAKLFGYSVDAILPISEYIIKRIGKFHKPYLKVPIEAEFPENISTVKKDNYFLYCVSAEYIRVIETVLLGFRQFINEVTGYDMVLILSGKDDGISNVSHLIKNLGLSDNVKIMHRVSYETLMALNAYSIGLVVPLDPDFEQDEARFSQKIAEYLASAGTIISNNVGEIKYYFKDRENIVLGDYSPKGFYNSFKWVVDNPTESLAIGMNGYKMGKEYFDFRVCGSQLHDFLLGNVKPFGNHNIY